MADDARYIVESSDSQTGGHNGPTVGFFCQEKGESRYEETIPDRTTTSRAAVPPDRHRRKPKHPDDSAAGRYRRLVAARRGQLATRDGAGADANRDGGRSASPGRGTLPATRRAPRASLGQRGRLLRGGWPESADSEDEVANQRQA